MMPAHWPKIRPCPFCGAELVENWDEINSDAAPWLTHDAGSDCVIADLMFFIPKIKDKTPKWLTEWNRRADAAKTYAELIPNNWLNPLLTGPNKVLGEQPWGCPQIEALLNALRERMLKHGLGL